MSSQFLKVYEFSQSQYLILSFDTTDTCLLYSSLDWYFDYVGLPFFVRIIFCANYCQCINGIAHFFKSSSFI